MFNTLRINIAIDQAIADAGGNGHFVLTGTPVKNIKPATNPLTINLPDGDHIKFTHPCQLDTPWLPEEGK